LQLIVDLRQLARKISNIFVIHKYNGVEFGSKFNKLPSTSRTLLAEYIQYIINPIQGFDLLVIIISIFGADNYISLFLFFFLPGDSLII
jgi:hypothetical protein